MIRESTAAEPGREEGGLCATLLADLAQEVAPLVDVEPADTWAVEAIETTVRQRTSRDAGAWTDFLDRSTPPRPSS